MGAARQGMQGVRNAGQGQEILPQLYGDPALLMPLFEPGRPISAFWPPEPQGDQSVVLGTV